MKRMGDLLSDLELVLEKIIDEHDLQHGEVLNLVHGWLMVHRPAAREEYLDGSHPILYYGSEEFLYGSNK